MGALHNLNWEATCQAYVLENLSQRKAYLKGFPSAAKSKITTVAVCASNLFKQPKIKARIAELKKEKNKVAKKVFAADAAYVLERLVSIDRMDIADILENEDASLKPVKEWPLIWRQFISKFEVEEIFAGRGNKRLKLGLLKKIQWPDKVRNLELLGKHVDVSAFKDVQEHTGPGGGPIQLITKGMTPEEASAAYADTLHHK